MGKALGFGLGSAVPDHAAAAWGARWIWPDDQLPNRQAVTGDEAAVEPLLAWLNAGANRKARDAARRMAGLDTERRPGYRQRTTARERLWTSRDDDQRTLFEDATGVIVGCPNQSHGYLYVAAWLKEPGNIPQIQETHGR